MANTTYVYYDGICEHDNTSHIFRNMSKCASIETLTVESFEDGIVTIETPFYCYIEDFAEFVAGCFTDDSNFPSEVYKAYGCNEKDTFEGIKFEFTGVTLIINKKNAIKEGIVLAWEKGMKANEEERRLKREAWLKTSEGQAYIAQQKAEEARRKAVKYEVLYSDKTIKMEFKDEEGEKVWKQIVKDYSKKYSKGIVEYARRWAKYMQKFIAEGKTVGEIAKETSHDCDIDGISGFMYSEAINILAQCWKYGEELCKWHNKNYGYEGDGIVNPAKLTVNVG